MSDVKAIKPPRNQNPNIFEKKIAKNPNRKRIQEHPTYHGEFLNISQTNVMNPNQTLKPNKMEFYHLFSFLT